MTARGTAVPEGTAGARADVARERRWGRVVGAAGLAAVGATLLALLLAARSGSAVGGGTAPEDQARRLADFDEDLGLQALGLGLRVLGLAITVAVAWYLARAVIDRGGRDGALLRTLGVAGPAALIVVLLVGFLGLQDVAGTFTDGPRTGERARDLVEDSGILQAVGIAEVAAHVLFGVWLIRLSLRMMGVGLLTRMLGYWGMGAGLVGMVLPIGDTLFIGWLASVSCLAWGWWPGGVPTAWRSGRAESLDIAQDRLGTTTKSGSSAS